MPPVASLIRDHRGLWWVLAITALVHIPLMVVPPLTGDEAVFWNWARHLALGYPTHPPFTGWAIAAVEAVFGTNIFTIRLTALLFHLATVWVTYRLALEAARNRPAAVLAAALYAALPISLVLGTTITSDCSLVFFWAATLLLLKKALVDRRERLWLAAGLTAGGMMLSKFFAVLLFPSVLGFLLAHPRYRGRLATPWPYLGFGVTLLTLVPFLYWNATHDWLPFQFNLVTRQAGNTFSLEKPLLYFAGQLLAASPFLALIALWAEMLYFFRGWNEARPGAAAFYRPRPADPAFWDTVFLYAWTVLFPLLVFKGVSYFARIGAHWTAGVMPAGVVLLALWLAALPAPGPGARGSAPPRRGWPARPVAFGFCVAGLLLVSLPLAALVLRPQLLPDRFLYYDAPPAETQKAGGHYFGYEALGRRLADLRTEWGTRPEGFFLSTEAYPLAGVMNFYTPGGAQIALVGYLSGEFHGKEFLLWGKPLKQKGANSIFFADKPIFPNRLFRIEPFFESVEELETLVIRDPQGRVLRKFFFALCRNYLDNEPDRLSVW